MIAIDLRGKTALVTGASQGLGTVIAERLHAAGAQVGLGFLDDPGGVNRTNAEQVVERLGSRAVALASDVRDPADMQRVTADLKEWYGTLDILVRNAGIVRDRTVKRMSDQEWQDVIDTNLTGVFHACRAAVELMALRGRIINIASLSAVMGVVGQANYGAAKAGVLALTRVLSMEVARRQITVNAVAPGLMLTEMGKTIPEENREAMRQQVPLGRFAEPSEVANCVLFLASDLASYVTGQTLHVNGGWWA